MDGCEILHQLISMQLFIGLKNHQILVMQDFFHHILCCILVGHEYDTSSPHTHDTCISVNVVKLINHPTHHGDQNVHHPNWAPKNLSALLGMVYYWATLVVRIIYIYIHINIHIRLHKYKSISITV